MLNDIRLFTCKVRNCWADWMIKSPNRHRKTSRKLSSTSWTMRRMNSAWKSKGAPLAWEEDTPGAADAPLWGSDSSTGLQGVKGDASVCLGAAELGIMTLSSSVSILMGGLISSCVLALLYLRNGLAARDGLEKATSLVSPLSGEKSELFRRSISLAALAGSIVGGNSGMRFESPSEMGAMGEGPPANCSSSWLSLVRKGKWDDLSDCSPADSWGPFLEAELSDAVTGLAEAFFTLPLSNFPGWRNHSGCHHVHIQLRRTFFLSTWWGRQMILVTEDEWAAIVWIGVVMERRS